MNTRNLRFRSNRVGDILSLFHEELDVQYGRGEVSAFCEMLFGAFLGWDRVRLLLGREATIDQSDLLRFHWALEDLHRCRPIQHIIGYADFCGCRIRVNPDVLIPRPETAEMVQWLTTHLPLSTVQCPLLDLCTGSGCIAIALKKAFPDAEVMAVDVSEAALKVARNNAELNGVGIHFFQADILNHPLSAVHYQLIVSNPPYVMEREREQMQRNVLEYDPALALFVPDDDPLLFYRAIAAIAQRHLAKEGLLAVEINEKLAAETCALFADYGFRSTVHTDFRGKPRWVEARRLEVLSQVGVHDDGDRTVVEE